VRAMRNMLGGAEPPPTVLRPRFTGLADDSGVMPHAPGDRAGTTAPGVPSTEVVPVISISGHARPSDRAYFAPFLSRCCGARRPLMEGAEMIPFG